MSLRPQPLEPVPEETARVTRAAFPKGNPYLTLRDQLGTIFQDEDFAALFPSCGQPGLSPWRLALVTLMQFRENLADRQAAEGKQQYQQRAGVEGTLSQGIRGFGLRGAKYRGLKETHFQQVATAAAINMDRLVAWLDNRPRTKTRNSRFGALAPI